MIKISFIGAGSAVFTKNLVQDLFLYPEFQNCAISLMDIDEKRLDLVARLVKKVIEEKNLGNVCLEITTDRQKAIKDSDYVIPLMRVGGIEACEKDVDIPLKYGVSQCMGDILGPGGVFRGLRSIPVLMNICREMEELCPDAWLLNYVNPMAIITRALYETTGIKVLGLCHSVVGTAKQLSKYMEIPADELTYFVAGINHMAWFLKLEQNGKNLYPLLFEKMKNKDVYDKDKVRFEMMKYFGFFVTESSYHMSEYVPYFRKDAKLVSEFGIPPKLGVSWVKDGWEKQEKEINDILDGTLPVTHSSSGEYAPQIIHSLETGVVRRINLNVENKGHITNLPCGACIEVPCLVDSMGVHPVHVGNIPPQLAALNRTNVNVQELASKGAMNCDREQIFQAIALDPNTSSVLSLPKIRKMVDEMFEEGKKYLAGKFYE